MIPVYNKGEYVLKVEPPPGWSFGKTHFLKQQQQQKTKKILFF
jgi:hypothetical protein